MRITQTTQFKKDIKLQKKRGKELQKLKEMVEILVRSEPLPLERRDHPLSGIGRDGAIAIWNPTGC